MSDKALVDFIAAQQRLGAHIEKIRSDLRANDWSDSDIDSALATLEENEKKRIVRERRFKKGVFVFFTLTVISAAVFIIYLSINKNALSPVSPKGEVVEFPNLDPIAVEETPVIATSTPIVDDIQQIKKKFGDQFPGAKYIRAQKENDYFVVSGIFKDETGTTTTKDLVFTKANNEWMFDTGKTDARIIEIQNNAPVPQPRLKISKFKIIPQPPAVNSKDTEIQIEFKNIGELASEPLTFSVIYDTRDPFEESLKTSIGPDQTFMWKYRPYPLGKKYDDKKGKHRITITLPNTEPFVQEFDLY